MSQDQIRISSEWGEVSATLGTGPAARSFADMLPLTIPMRDHLRQEKTGTLPAALLEERRQRDYSVGTLGLWDADHFVIYYRSGRVPSPGIIVLGHVDGDVTILDRPGPVVVTVERVELEQLEGQPVTVEILR